MMQAEIVEFALSRRNCVFDMLSCLMKNTEKFINTYQLHQPAIQEAWL